MERYHFLAPAGCQLSIPEVFINMEGYVDPQGCIKERAWIISSWIILVKTYSYWLSSQPSNLSSIKLTMHGSNFPAHSMERQISSQKVCDLPK